MKTKISVVAYPTDLGFTSFKAKKISETVDLPRGFQDLPDDFVLSTDNEALRISLRAEIWLKPAGTLSRPIWLKDWHATPGKDRATGLPSYTGTLEEI